MATRSIPVRDRCELDRTVSALQAQGYALTWYAPPTATLMRSSSISCGVLAVLILVGWLVLWIPLFVYLIWFAFNHQETVSVYIYSPLPALPRPGDLSADGGWWWDGSGWQSADILAAPLR